MFDIGFSEIVVIGVVALVVIGPERLPKTARTLGHLFGRLQRYVNDVKADINREMELDELRKLQREMQGAAREFEQSVTTAASDMQAGLRNVERQLNEQPPATAAPSATSAASPTPAGSDADPPRQPALPGFDKI
ncbi:MAG TPA: Sec-independent protein translocase protein TatB [Casimicrobiaceae bacterium]|nr:Sec-independent protein translocase protein TatB [Casimicrobiaceae bacterium]